MLNKKAGCRCQSLVNFLAEIFFSYNLKNNRLITTSTFKFNSGTEIGRSANSLGDKRKIGIVIQGPIVKSRDFTLKICLQFRHWYPNVQIILSTWLGEKDEYLDKFRSAGIEVVLSEEPHSAGLKNINKQIISTKAGLSKLRGCEFVLKTRTDIFFRSEFFLFTLLESFFENEVLGRNNRIMVTSFNTFLNRPYSFNDQVQFGYFDSINKFWNCPLDYRDINQLHLRLVDANLLEWSEAEVVEVWLVKNYLREMGFDPSQTIQASLCALRDYFIVFDEAVVGMFWFKRNIKEIYSEYRNPPYPSLRRVEPADWLRLQRLNT